MLELRGAKMKKTATVIYFAGMLAQAVLWIVLGSMTIAKSAQVFPQTLIGTLMLADAAAFAAFAFLHSKTNILIRVMIFGFLAANLILTFTDQMGAIDFAVLGLNVVCIAGYIAIVFMGRKKKA